MRQTYCVVKLDMIDITALDDATVTSDYNQSFGSLERFKSQQAIVNYGTLELNRFTLDGSYTGESAPSSVAFMSKAKSLGDCTFSANPKVNIAFTQKHTSIGLELFFGLDYPREIKITWLTLAGSKITSETFYPDSLDYICDKQVENYGQIQIDFVKTRLPYGYATLQYIRYGYTLLWGRSNIKGAKIYEEVDLTSATLSINTADVTILDPDNTYNTKNQEGLWKSIQKAQKMVIQEYYNDNLVECGTFYIDGFSAKSNSASFQLIDSVGLLDNYQFTEGEIYTGKTAGEIVKAIFDSTGNTVDYELDEDISSISLTGWLGVMTCREALQMVAFACNALVDDSRGDIIKIYKPNREIQSIISIDRKFNNSTELSLDEYVSGIALECPIYTLSSESNELYNDELPAGPTTIIFDNPVKADSVTASTGTLDKVTTNYLTITMAEAGACTITGLQYEKTAYTYTKSVDNLEAGQTENIKTFSGATLYNPQNLASHANYLLDYYDLRQTGSSRIILEHEGASQWTQLKDRDNNSFYSLIENANIDLAGGFIATLSLRGYNKVVSEYDYTGEIMTSQPSLL